MPLTADQWPEELPPASQPPGHEATRGAGATASDLDPGHLMTDEEWRRVQSMAESMERAQESHDAG